MAEFPDQWDLLRADPSLARAAFEENLRFQSPARIGGRMTTRATELGGVHLPEGALVLVLQLPANRDPRRWEDPDRFDITRRSAGHVGLGYGIHACVGQAVARIEGVSLVTELARRVERIELLGPAVYKLNQGVHAIDRLPVRTHAGLDPPVARVERPSTAAKPIRPGGDDPEQDRPVRAWPSLASAPSSPTALSGS